MTSTDFLSKVGRAFKIDLNMKFLSPSLVVVWLLIGNSSFTVRAQNPLTPQPGEPKETRLKDLKQLTFGGQNAEA